MDILIFEAIFRLHYNDLCNYALRYIQNKDVAEDIVQNFFITIWEKDIKLTEENILPYAYTAIRNGCINYYKSELIRENFLNEALEELEFQNEEEEPFLYKKEVRLAVYKLPEKCRKVFLLKCIHDLKYKEIAEIMGISVNTVKYHLGEAFRMMREELKDLL